MLKVRAKRVTVYVVDGKETCPVPTLAEAREAAAWKELRVVGDKLQDAMTIEVSWHNASEVTAWLIANRGRVRGFFDEADRIVEEVKVND